MSMMVMGACGIIYEYALGALGSNLVGSTHEQIFVVIALMMFAMGVGSVLQKFVGGNLIEKFISDITGKVDVGYVDRALGYLDTKQFPVDVMVPGYQGVYDEAQTPKLIKAFRRVFKQRFKAANVRVRSKRYEIDGDRAEVKLNLLSKAFGMAKWEFTLRKGTTGWKVSRVYVIR